MVHLNARREGFALASAIAALVLIGVLVTGGFVAATHEGAISESTRFAAEAFNAAEYGLSEIVGTWEAEAYQNAATLSPVLRDLCRDGSTVLQRTACPQGGAIARYSVEVSSLGESGKLFLVRSTGEVPRHGFFNQPRRTLARVVRLTNFAIAMDRAFTAGAGLDLDGNAKIDGRDTNPDQWSGCEAPLPAGQSAAVVARDTSQVKSKPNKEQIIGGKRQDPSINADTFERFGDLTYDDLAALATVRFNGNLQQQKTNPSLTSSNQCNYADQLNWGAPEDPNHKCRNYFPIIHITGNMDLKANSTGQGILLVDGNIDVNGGFRFYGIVITRGKISRNGDAKIFGTVYAKGGADLNVDSDLLGNANIQFSTCAVARAIQENDAFKYGRPIAARSWFDLSAAGADM